MISTIRLKGNMSKVVVFFYTSLLLAVVLTNAENGESSIQIQVVFEKIVSLVNNGSEKVKHVYNEANNKASEIAKKLQDSASTTVERTIDAVTNAIKNLDDRIDRLKEDCKNCNTSECELLTKDYRQNAANIVVDSSICLVDVMGETDGYIGYMKYLSENILSDLEKINVEVKECTLYEERILNVPKALLCLTNLTPKAVNIAVKDVDSTVTKIEKMIEKLGNASIKLASCYLEKSLRTVTDDVTIVADKYAKCLSKFKI